MPRTTISSIIIAALGLCFTGCYAAPDDGAPGSVKNTSEAVFTADLFECKINGCIVENLCLPPGSTPRTFEQFSECAVDGCPGEGVIDCVAEGGTVIDTGPCNTSNPEYNSKTFVGPFPICP